jgi:hypothetical protein
LLSTFISCFWNNTLECLPIKSIKNSRLSTYNSCCSWCSVHQSQLSKILTSFICFKVSFNSIDHFRAVVFSWANNIESESFITLFDYLITFLLFFHWHRIHNNVYIIISKCSKQNWFFQKIIDTCFNLIRFRNNFWNKLLFFIKQSICFCTNCLPTNLFLFLFFLELFIFKIDFIFILITLIRITINLTLFMIIYFLWIVYWLIFKCRVY